jgi:hypothetical protein
MEGFTSETFIFLFDGNHWSPVDAASVCTARAFAFFGLAFACVAYTAYK